MGLPSLSLFQSETENRPAPSLFVLVKYPASAVSSVQEARGRMMRSNASIREKILLNYDKEVPYSTEVIVEKFDETDNSIHIMAVIYVERDSQKGIIIGHKGVALKKVSTEARKSLEKFFGKSIYLEIFVKVDKDWRQSAKAMKQYGYDLGD